MHYLLLVHTLAHKPCASEKLSSLPGPLRLGAGRDRESDRHMSTRDSDSERAPDSPLSPQVYRAQSQAMMHQQAGQVQIRASPALLARLASTEAQENVGARMGRALSPRNRSDSSWHGHVLSWHLQSSRPPTRSPHTLTTLAHLLPHPGSPDAGGSSSSNAPEGGLARQRSVSEMSAFFETKHAARRAPNLEPTRISHLTRAPDCD